MPVLGPVVDEEEQRRRGQALDEAIEERLGLRVDPVEILDDQQEWLRLRLAQDEALDRIQYPLPALRRVESLPLRILERHVEEGEQRGKRRLQRTVQGEDSPGDLFQDVSMRVAVADPEIALQEIDHGQVAGGLAVRHRACFQHEPALRARGAHQLEDEARLAHARLADDGRHLPTALPGLLQRAMELCELGVAAHEPGEAARGGCLEPRAHLASLRHLIGFHRLAEILHGH